MKQFISTPHNNDRFYTPKETEYIQKTAEEFNGSLQRAGIVWPLHEIQELICKNFQLIKTNENNLSSIL